MKHFEIHAPRKSLSLHRARVMGILNLTQDSFFDGGAYTSLEDQVSRAWDIMEEGADILDVGAESTRPGALPVSIQDEIQTLEPVLKALSQDNYPLPISLDTSKPEVVHHFASKKWVDWINDVTGLRNPEMVRTVQEHALPVVVMHMFGDPQTMQETYAYENVVTDIHRYFEQTLSQHETLQNVILDPGIGFGKSMQHNLTLIKELDAFADLQCPILLGASRKSFIGKALDLDVQDRMIPSLAVAAIAVERGCHILRVHDVKETVQTVQMVEKIIFSSESRTGT